MTNPLVLPRLIPVADIPGLPDMLRGTGILLPDEARRLDAIERTAYCLLRIDGEGERWRCRECNGKHAHATRLCIPRPFRGLRDGLHAYWQNTAVPSTDLTPTQQARRRQVGRMLGFADVLPSLADHHPETARALGTRDSSTDIGAWVFGIIDPISPARARQFMAQINAKARRTVVRL